MGIVIVVGRMHEELSIPGDTIEVGAEGMEHPLQTGIA
jgi:hypothetical protein